MSARIRIAVLSLGSVAVALAGVALAQSACTVLSNDALPDDATFDGASEASVPACTECLAQACVGTWAVCLADDGCRGIRACAVSATDFDASCSGLCTVSGLDGGPDPAGAYFVFSGCTAGAATTCASDCSDAGDAGSVPSATCRTSSGSDGGDAGPDAGDGGDASTPTPVTADGCTSCIAGACGDPAKACASGTDCSAFLACVYACTDASCQNACETSHATGKESASELASCAVISCAVPCGY